MGVQLPNGSRACDTLCSRVGWGPGLRVTSQAPSGGPLPCVPNRFHALTSQSSTAQRLVHEAPGGPRLTGKPGSGRFAVLGALTPPRPGHPPSLACSSGPPPTSPRSADIQLGGTHSPSISDTHGSVSSVMITWEEGPSGYCWHRARLPLFPFLR